MAARIVLMSENHGANADDDSLRLVLLQYVEFANWLVLAAGQEAATTMYVGFVLSELALPASSYSEVK